MKKIIFALLLSVALSTSLAKGVVKDDAEAVKLYGLAAAQGDMTAQFNLGHMYRDGRGVVQNYAEAAKWYRLAAAQGLIWAQVELGDSLSFGRGVTQDKAEAAKWYRLAAGERHARASMQLGLIHGSGKGVVLDLKKSYMWLIIAAYHDGGESDTVKAIDEVSKRMTAQQISEAQAMARQCKKRSFKGCD